MDRFETFEDVEEWLAPLGFEAFWQAIETLEVFGSEDRRHCEATLANGIADMETVMEVTKRMALHEIVARERLPFRCELARKPDLRVVT